MTELCQACHASTGGNPFLLEALATALRAPGDGDLPARVDSLGPEPVAQAVLRRVGQLGEGAGRLTRALAVLGGPAPLRHAAALAGQDASAAAQLADRLRAADVLAPGSVLEFAHPIVRTAIYESIPPGERALAHAEAARLLERDGADAERIALHLLRSEPAGSARGSPCCARPPPRPAAAAPPARPRTTCAARWTSRPSRRPGRRSCSSWGSPWPASAARPPRRYCGRPSSWPGPRRTAGLPRCSPRGSWASGVTTTAWPTSAATRCRAQAGPEAADSLEAELFANSLISAATPAEATARAGSRLAAPDASSTWRVYDALSATSAAQPAGDALARLAPVLAGGLAEIPPDSLTAVYALLVLIWNDELGTARSICDAVLAAARSRGSMSMVAHVSCLRSMIMRRLGQLEDAAADGRLALDFKLATSPPLAVAWAAAPCVDALTCLGRLDEAEAVAAAAAERQPPPGWIHTLCSCRPAARCGWRSSAPPRRSTTCCRRRGLARPGLDNPAIASWRTAAAAAHAALGHPDEAASPGRRATRAGPEGGHRGHAGGRAARHAPTAAPQEAGPSLAEAVSLLEATPARYELALALADLGAHLRRTGRPGEARAPLRRALDLAQRCGAAPLADEARRELLATGARPRRTALTGPDALTSAERRVAELAADGLSNRQIAQHLFITLPTVETHLRHAFRKLGITSRAGLPAQLASQARPGSLPDEPALAVTGLPVPEGRDGVKGPG